MVGYKARYVRPKRTAMVMMYEGKEVFGVREKNGEFNTGGRWYGNIQNWTDVQDKKKARGILKLIKQ